MTAARYHHLVKHMLANRTKQATFEAVLSAANCADPLLVSWAYELPKQMSLAAPIVWG